MSKTREALRDSERVCVLCMWLSVWRKPWKNSLERSGLDARFKYTENIELSQGWSVNINMQKMHFVPHEAHRQGKRVYRVDIDLKNAFNAMSQAALWHVMNMFHISDVDFLEQIYAAQQSLWLQTTQKVQQSRLIQV